MLASPEIYQSGLAKLSSASGNRAIECRMNGNICNILLKGIWFIFYLITGKVINETAGLFYIIYLRAYFLSNWPQGLSCLRGASAQILTEFNLNFVVVQASPL